MLTESLEKFEDVFKPFSSEELMKRPPQVSVFEGDNMWKIFANLCDFVDQLGGFTYVLPCSKGTGNLHSLILSRRKLNKEELERMYAELKEKELLVDAY